MRGILAQENETIQMALVNNTACTACITHIGFDTSGSKEWQARQQQLKEAYWKAQNCGRRHWMVFDQLSQVSETKCQVCYACSPFIHDLQHVDFF